MSRKRKSAATPRSIPPASAPPGRWFRSFSILALIGILLFILVVRIRLLDIPFERDEGGFAYMGKMMFQGVPLYTELRDIKLPGLYLTYGAIVQLAGASPRGVHTGLLVFNLAGITLLFLLTRRLFGNLAATVAAATHAVLTVSPGLFGFAAHATQLLLVPALAGLLVLVKAVESGRKPLLLLAGLLLGLAFAIKQSSALFTVFGATYLLLQKAKLRPFPLRDLIRDEALLILASIFPYGVSAAAMALSGSFDAFWFWTFEWPRQFAALSGFTDRMNLLRFSGGIVTRGQMSLWVLSGLGFLLSPFLLRKLPNLTFAYLFAFFSAAAVSTGFHYYPHYFVMLVPAVAMFAGLLVLGVSRTLGARSGSRWVVLAPVAVFALLLIESVRSQPDFYLRPNPTRILRRIYGANPFPESQTLGRFVRSARRPGDTMAVIGSEPQLYLYADCPAASGHLFMYPLVDGGAHARRLQDELIQEVEAAAPRFLVLVNVTTSWLSRDPQERVLRWAGDYAAAHYQAIAVADIVREGTVYKWNAQARGFTPKSSNFLVVFERRPPPTG